MSPYPVRQSHHAHRLTRLLFKGCAAQSIGHHAVCLVIHIAHTEDAARYQGPVRFWNSQLMEVLGFKSPKQLNNARDAAVAAGWLVYERKNIRSVGHYWTTAPESVSEFNDSPIEPIHSESGTNRETIHSESGTNREAIHSESGTNRKPIHSESGTSCGTNSGKLSNPSPNPKKEEGAATAAASSSSKKRTPKQPRFAPESIDLPTSLDTDRFRDAWESWCSDRAARRKPVTEAAANLQLKKLAAMGESKAVRSIENSIAGGWSGLFEPDPTGTVRAPPSAADKRAPTIDELAAMPATPRKAGPR